MSNEEASLRSVAGEGGAPENVKRAWAGFHAVKGYAAHTGGWYADDLAEEAGYADGEEMLELVGDVVADLMHLARWHGVDVEELVTRGRMHFYAEAMKSPRKEPA